MDKIPKNGVGIKISLLLKNSVWIKYSPLWVAFVLYIVLAPLLMGPIGNFLLTALFSILLISSLIAVSDNRRTIATVSILLLLTLISRWVAYGEGGSGTLELSLLLSTITLSVVTLILFRSLFKVKEVMTSTIWRAISIYILIGLTWGMFFSFCEQVAPGTFVDSVLPASSLTTQTLIYFSFVTLATLGYGDILPATPEARSLAIIEVVVGVLYLAILISRLVGTWHPGEEKEDR